MSSANGDGPDPFFEWLDAGVRAGFCTKPVCATHDGLPTTEEEDRLNEEGYDPCLPAVRLLSGDDDCELRAERDPS